VKSFFCAALTALLPPLLLAGALSSADYQEGIREATERYRGDGNEGVIFTGYYVRGARHSDLENGLPPFPPEPFTLRNTVRAEAAPNSPTFH